MDFFSGGRSAYAVRNWLFCCAISAGLQLLKRKRAEILGGQIIVIAAAGPEFRNWQSRQLPPDRFARYAMISSSDASVADRGDNWS